MASKNHRWYAESLYVQSNRPWEKNTKKIFNTWAAYGVTTVSKATLRTSGKQCSNII